MSNRERLKAAYDALGKKLIKVGFFDTSKYPDGTPIAYVAVIHELGYPAGGIPPRSFFRPAMSENVDGYRGMVKRGVIASANGAISLQAVLEQIGAKAASDVKMSIRAVTTPALKESTVKSRARRHSKGKSTDKPLVDSGQMLQAANYVVEDK